MTALFVMRSRTSCGREKRTLLRLHVDGGNERTRPRGRDAIKSRSAIAFEFFNVVYPDSKRNAQFAAREREHK